MFQYSFSSSVISSPLRDQRALSGPRGEPLDHVLNHIVHRNLIILGLGFSDFLQNICYILIILNKPNFSDCQTDFLFRAYNSFGAFYKGTGH